MGSPPTNSRVNSAGSAKLGICLTALLAIPAAIFFICAAYSPATLAVQVVPGQPVTVWILYRPLMILFASVLSGIYLLAANRAARSACVASGLLALAVTPAHAATGSDGLNDTAVFLFAPLVLLTLAITYWAARRTRSAKDFYAAGGNLSGLQNGLAITGDVISAGAFLGLAGLVYGAGFDGLLYAAGYAVSYPVIGLLFADRMRNLGKFTFADIVSYRLAQTPVRTFAASARW